MRPLWLFLQAVYYHLLCSYRMWQVRRCLQDDVVYVTSRNVQIRVYPGRKQQSPHDFIVRFQEPGKRERTPRHVHIIVEMYVKHAYNPDLTLRLRDHILEMFRHVQPADTFPPTCNFSSQNRWSLSGSWTT